MPTESNLSLYQQKVIESLVSGYDQKTSARIAGVNEQTVSRWMKKPEFQRGLRQARKEVHDVWLADFKDQLREMVPEAMSLMRKNLAAKIRTTPYAQIRSMETLLDKIIQLEELERIPQLEQEIEELRAMLGQGDDGVWQQ